jgi:hypothetical protein
MDFCSGSPMENHSGVDMCFRVPRVMGCSHPLFAPSDARHHRFNHKNGNAVTNAPITTSERPDIDHPMNGMATKCDMLEVALIKPLAENKSLS